MSHVNAQGRQTRVPTFVVGGGDTTMPLSRSSALPPPILAGKGGWARGGVLSASALEVLEVCVCKRKREQESVCERETETQI